ncbi:MAG: hypothetical protein K8I00_09825, partial [Candidatus Omnitrophica bacterium]|nr:hypothetical protein [Candidatus Omnitrophota bacterium]
VRILVMIQDGCHIVRCEAGCDETPLFSHNQRVLATGNMTDHFALLRLIATFVFVAETINWCDEQKKRGDKQNIDHSHKKKCTIL